MSIRVMTWAFEQRIPANIKIVLLSLADNANDDGYCWPSQETIAYKSSVSVRNLRRLITQLEERGLIRVERRNDRDGHRASNGYYVGLPDKMAGGPTGQIDTAYRPTVSSQEPSVEPPKIDTAGEPDLFDAFWEKYPKKVAKADAQRAWAKAIKKTPPAEIIAGLERLLPGFSPDLSFVKGPAAWLNGQRWTDDFIPPSSSTRQGQPQRPKIDPQREWEYR
jgi:hypothetical protein